MESALRESLTRLARVARRESAHAARPRRRVEANHRDDTGSLTRSGVDGNFLRVCFQRERERERTKRKLCI